MITLNANSTHIVNATGVPQDGVDPVAQASVNPAFQDLLDSMYYCARTQVFTRPHVYIRWIGNTQISVRPFRGIWVSTTTPAENWVALDSTTEILVGAGNIEGGGGFANSTAYYIYLYSNAGNPAIQLSTTAPEDTLTFKGTGMALDISKRYIGHLVTDGTGKILQFHMVDFEYWIQPISLGAPVSTTTTASANYTIPAPFPTQIKVLNLQVDVSTLDTNVNTNIQVSPTYAVAPSTISTFFFNSETGLSAYQGSYMIEMPFSYLGTIKVTAHSAGGATVGAAPEMNGYRE